MKAIIYLLTAVLIVSCAKFQPPERHEFNRYVVIDASVQEVYDACLRFLESEGTIITTSDREGGLIVAKITGIEKSGERSAWIDCGTLNRDVPWWQNGAMELNITVREHEQGARVGAVTSFDAENYAYTTDYEGGGRRRPCESTGVFEMKLFSYIK